MALEKAVDTVVVEAPKHLVREASLDYESYPVWARSLREVVVRERDAEGRGLVVAYSASAFGRRIRYTLRYDYTLLPDVYSWTIVEGDARTMDGDYRFEGLDDNRTRVTYRLAVELSFPLPRFILRRAERLVMSIALKELKAYVES